MKRKSFLLALVSVFGVRAAQKEEEFKLEEPLVLPVPNGQCPVCVTQAPPWHLPEDSKKGVTYNMSKLVRCKVCSVAFWQDCEEAKG